VRELFSTCVPKDPTIFARNGRLFLSVPFEVPSLPCKDDTSLGVDLGMKRFFVTSEGKSFVDKEYLKERRKLRYLKRCLQSKGSHSSKRHLQRLSHK
jgi:transposase